MQPKLALRIVKETAKEFMEDKAPRLSAALAYYTLFSLAPLLVIVIAIAGFAFDEATARQKIIAGLGEVLGPTGQKAVTEMIANASTRETTGIIATIIGFITLLLGASGVFGQLKDALNTIWDVKKDEGGIGRMIRDRFLSFTMVLGTGFLLLVSLVITATVSALGERLIGGDAIAHSMTFIVSLAVITGVFAMLFKYLPDKPVQWRDVWVGAFFTALLFTAGKFAIGLWLGKSSIGSTFGAAASLAILLVWLYYSAMIFFFGAEFTEVYARATRNGREGEGAWEPRRATAVALLPAPPPVGRRLPPPAARADVPTRRSTGRVAAAGAAGVFVGVLAGGVATAMMLLKGVRKILRA